MFENFPFPRQILVGVGAAAVTWILWKRFAEPQGEVLKDAVELEKSPDYVSAEPKGNLTDKKTKTKASGKELEKSFNRNAEDDDKQSRTPSEEPSRSIVPNTGTPDRTLESKYGSNKSSVHISEEIWEGQRKTPIRFPNETTDMKNPELEKSPDYVSSKQKGNLTHKKTKTATNGKKPKKSLNRDAEDDNKHSRTPSEEQSRSTVPNTRTSDHNIEQGDGSNKSSPDILKKTLKEKPETPMTLGKEMVKNGNETDVEEDKKLSREGNWEGSISPEDKVTTEKKVNENTRHSSTIPRENSTERETTKCGGVPVVLDIGSHEIKAGFVGDYEPAFTLRNVIGKLRRGVAETWGRELEDTLYADEALRRRNILRLQYPLQDGIVQDCKNLQDIIDWILCHRLNVNIEDHPLLIVEPSLRPKSQREELLEIVIEGLHCPMVQFQQQSVLSAQVTNKNVALVVTSGHSCTEVVPVYYGSSIHHAIQKVPVGGQHITEYLGRLLSQNRKMEFEGVAGHLPLESIKEKYAEIRGDHDSLNTSPKTIQHILSDGRTLKLGEEIYKCTEPLYKPDLVIGDHHEFGLCEAIKKAIDSVDVDLQAKMRSNVLVTGGNSKLKGFRKSLSEKLYSIDGTRNSRRWQVTQCDDPTNSAWLGGASYAASDQFRDWCITDDMYLKYGSSIIHRMCP